MDNELEIKLQEALTKYTSTGPIFLTGFEEVIFKHAFQLGYQEGRERGFKEGVKDAI